MVMQGISGEGERRGGIEEDELLEERRSQGVSGGRECTLLLLDGTVYDKGCSLGFLLSNLFSFYCGSEFRRELDTRVRIYKNAMKQKRWNTLKE